MIRICIDCEQAIVGEAETIERFSDSGAGRNLYRHLLGTPDCVAQSTGRGIAHRR